MPDRLAKWDCLRWPRRTRTRRDFTRSVRISMATLLRGSFEGWPHDNHPAVSWSTTRDVLMRMLLMFVFAAAGRAETYHMEAHGCVPLSFSFVGDNQKAKSDGSNRGWQSSRVFRRRSAL